MTTTINNKHKKLNFSNERKRCLATSATRWLDVQGRALCPSATRMAKKLSVHIGCGRPQGPHPAKRLKDDIFSNLHRP